MADKPHNLQDYFLNSVRRSKSPVTIFLVKGVKLQGVITWFDAFSLLLRRDGASQLVYKHSISTVMPQTPPADVVEAAAAQPAPTGRTSLQDQYLAAAGREREAMTIFLINGVMLQGSVIGFDQFSLLLERGGQVQLVYKHAVSTLQSARPLVLAAEQDGGATEANPE